MTKSLIIKICVLTVSIVLVAWLFSLPKEIIDNPKEDEISKGVAEVDKEHSETRKDKKPLTDSNKLKVDALYQKFIGEDSLELRTYYLDTIIDIYVSIDRFDLLGAFLEEKQKQNNNMDFDVIIGNVYFTEFNQVKSEAEKKKYGKKAIAAYNKVLSDNPENHFVMARKAVIQIETESPPMKGIANLKKSLALGPDNIEGHLYLASFRVKVNKIDEAITSFKTVISLDPSNVRALIRLGDLYKFRKNNRKAVVYYSQALNFISDPLLKEGLEKEIKKLKE